MYRRTQLAALTTGSVKLVSTQLVSTQLVTCASVSVMTHTLIPPSVDGTEGLRPCQCLMRWMQSCLGSSVAIRGAW